MRPNGAVPRAAANLRRMGDDRQDVAGSQPRQPFAYGGGDSAADAAP